MVNIRYQDSGIMYTVGLDKMELGNMGINREVTGARRGEEERRGSSQ